MTAGRPAWHDVETHGRTLNSIIQDMNTKYQKESDPELSLAYIDRLLKSMQQIRPLIDMYLGVSDFLKEAEKKRREELLIQQ